MDSAGINISTDSIGQNAPWCASSGDGFLVSFNTYDCDGVYMDIFLARVNAQGEVLDTNGFPVCTAEGHQYDSKVSCEDGRLMVIWQDERNSESAGYDVYGARVTSNGTVLDPQGIRIARSSSWEKSPDVAWTGEVFLAIWEEGYYEPHWDISSARIDTSGEVLDSIPTVISAACDAQLFGTSVWSGCSYLAVWEEDGDLCGARLDSHGDVLDSAIVPICSVPEDQRNPDLVWGEGEFFAVWEDFRDHNFDIYGARIDSSGLVVEPLGLPLYVGPATDQRRPAVAFDGENYLVAWQEMLDSTEANYRIEGLRVSPSGTPLDPQPLSFSEGDKGSYPDVAFGGEKYLAVWMDANLWDIHGALVETDGTVGSVIGIRIAGGLQQNPAVASDGNAFLVVWEDCGTHWPNADIVATRVTSGGEILDPSGIIISMTADAAEELPSITFDGTNYLVAWRRTTGPAGELYASRITPEGVVLDPGGILISEISPYSGICISFGPSSGELIDPKRQSLMLYSKYEAEPYNSPRIFGALFWGEPEPNLPPEPFSLLLPVDQDTVIRPVFLDWEDAYDPNPSDQVRYTVYVSSSEQFHPESTLVVDSLSSSQCYLAPEEDGLLYWWKVKAQDRWDEARWSNQTWNFALESYGDVNQDGKVDPGDAVYLINYLFREGPAPQPLAAGDVNGDCEVNAGDVMYMINYLFKEGPRPQAGCA